jgi:hypothetical protein
MISFAIASRARLLRNGCVIRGSSWGLVIFALCLFCAPADGKPLAIREVYLERHTENDFRRLSSRFHARPPNFPFTVLRTAPDQWEGVYFVLSMNRRAKNLPPDAEINLRYRVGGNPVLHEFSLPIVGFKPRSREIWVGLTGPGQQGAEPRNFHAWAIDIRRNGEILCTKKSFLFREN